MPVTHPDLHRERGVEGEKEAGVCDKGKRE